MYQASFLTTLLTLDINYRETFIMDGILYYSAIKWDKFSSVLVRWMKLWPIIQIKVNQKEKNKYHALMRIYGIQKNDNDEPICRTKIETQTYKTDVWTQWGRRERDELREQHCNMYITICNLDSLCEFADAGNSNKCSVTTQKCGMG